MTDAVFVRRVLWVLLLLGLGWLLAELSGLLLLVFGAVLVAVIFDALAVVLFVLVRELYVKRTLGDPVPAAANKADSP